MDEGNSIIYGLEHQTRALSPQYGESDAIRFLIGTQSLKPQSNQVHVVELEEDTGALHTKVFKHDIGEIWHLRCSPHDVAMLMTTHNAYDPLTSQCTMGVTLFKLPTVDVIPKDLDDLSAIQSRNAEDMVQLKTITPEGIGEFKTPLELHIQAGVKPVIKPPRRIPLALMDRLAAKLNSLMKHQIIEKVEHPKSFKPEEEVRCAEWHPVDSNRIGIVYEGCMRVHDVNNGEVLANVAPEGRARLKFTGGKWNPHQGHCQFALLQDMHLKCYDTRTDCAKPSWSIDNAHRQLVRDLDFNPNRQFHVATAGDDAALNIWDYRNGKEPIFSRTDHSHWVWTVRYNTYHEQLLLTGSSDARALLTAAASVCQDTDGEGKKITQVLEDGVLQSYEQHEDSVYCAEWSAAEPWTFASLSHDARLVLARVPRHFKYKILL